MKQLYTLLAIGLGTSLAAQTLTTYTTANGLPTNNLRDVAIDAGGNIWLATQMGVARFDGTNFTVHNTTTHPGLVNDGILAIATTSNGDVWVGTDFGASVFNGTSYTTYTTADGLGENQITNIKQAPNGDVWLATLNGATLYSNGTFTAFSSPNIPFGGTTYIAFAANGDVWLGGGLGGIIIYNGSTFSTLTTADGLLSNKIRSIAFDGSENKWVATAKGISMFNATNAHTGDHTRPFILPAPDTLNPVTDVALDSQGVVWAAVYVDYLVTVGGVSAYDGSSWRQYEQVDGLAGPNVRRMAIATDDAVWVTTSTGLTKISGFNIGIAERAKGPEFALYPNPAAQELNIVLDSSTSERKLAQLFDARMRLLLSEPISGGRVRIDLSRFDAGLYVARIDGSMRKFVVAR